VAALQRKEIIRNQPEFTARQVRPLRAATGGDDDVRRRKLLAIDRDGVRIQKARPADHMPDVLARQIARIDAVQTLDVGITFGLEAGPVLAGDGHIKPIVARIVHQVREARRVVDQLLGHAADVDAGSAQRRGLDHGNPRAVFHCSLRGREATTATTDGDEIKLFRHVHIALLARERASV
jgi:hypothetical protein